MTSPTNGSTMQEHAEPNSSASTLIHSLVASSQAKAAQQPAASSYSQTVNVVGIGAGLASAYEQLRNVAEYAEDHLLLQRALRRYFKRSGLLEDPKVSPDFGEEVVAELTSSGYLKNNTVTLDVAASITDSARKYHGLFPGAVNSGVPRPQVVSWVYDALSVEIENLLTKGQSESAFVRFSYEHYLAALKATDQNAQVQEAAVYVAVHKAIFKSDLAIVRHSLLIGNAAAQSDAKEFARMNRWIDDVFASPQVAELTRTIISVGAPLRVLREMTQQQADIGELLADRQRFLLEYRRQISIEYAKAGARIRTGLVRSIIFLIITKFIVGIAIEIPYDLYVHGAVAVLPLVINLVSPPLFMALLGLGIKTPGSVNTEALVHYIDAAIYGTPDKVIQKSTASKSRHSPGFNFVYALTFVFAFGAIGWTLFLLRFNIVQGALFFIFLSTASFLGFRLSRIVSELELVSSNQGFLNLLGDVIFTPFIVVGQWVSSKYSHVNIVARVLDMAIELPLKTSLRLIRQWTSFLSEKKDRI